MLRVAQATHLTVIYWAWQELASSTCFCKCHILSLQHQLLQQVLEPSILHDLATGTVPEDSLNVQTRSCSYC